MNVLFLADYYTPHEIGGAERSAHQLAIELTGAGHAVVVATPNYGAASRERVDGIEIVRLPFPQHLAPGQLAKRRWVSNPVIQALYAIRIARLLRRCASAVLHVQNSGFAAAGSLAGRLAQVPVVITIRDLAYVHPEPDSIRTPADARRRWAWAVDRQWARAERRLKRAALGHAAGIVFVSRGLRDVYARSGRPDLAERGRVVYNIGPDRPPCAARAPRDPRMVLFVGKLSTGKGVGVLYRAAERVTDTLPDVHFEMIGLPGVGFAPPPPQIAPSFCFRGRLHANDVADLMGRASVLVAPSIWPEPLSRVLLEAMAAELPIVATAVGGTPEALEHESSALLAPAEDPDALAAALLRLLTDPAYGASLAARARRRFENCFSSEAILPQMLNVYENARARY